MDSVIIYDKFVVIFVIIPNNLIRDRDFNQVTLRLALRISAA